MAKHTAHQVRNFVDGLEEKKRNLRFHNEYVNSPYYKQIIIKVKGYLNSLYLNSSGDNFYAFDFEIDEEDIDYFINKYRAQVPKLERKERYKKLQRLEKNKKEIKEKINMYKHGSE